MPARNGGKIPQLKNCGLDSRKIADDYPDLNLTQNMSAGNTGYHSVNGLVPNRDIASNMGNVKMNATIDQIHVDQLMEIFR